MAERSLRRMGAACGILGVVLEVVGLGIAAISSPKLVDATLGSSEREIARVFASPATTGVWVGLYLEVVGFLFLVVFVARLWDTLRRAEGGTGWISNAAFGAGASGVRSSPPLIGACSKTWPSRPGSPPIPCSSRETCSARAKNWSRRTSPPPSRWPSTASSRRI